MNSPFVTTKVLDYVTSVVSPEVKAELDRMKMSYELSNGSHLEWRTKDLESDPRDSYPELRKLCDKHNVSLFTILFWW